MRQTINKGRTSYHPNSLGGGCPFQAAMKDGGFTSYAERVDAHKVRERSRSFFDHFGQARLFYNSQSDHEKNHIIDAFSFELGKVETIAIRQRMLGIISLVDESLAASIGANLGLKVPAPEKPINKSVPADGNQKDYEPMEVDAAIDTSPALSMSNTIKNTIKGRKIAFLAADGVDADAISQMKAALEAEGAKVEIVAPRQGTLNGANKAKQQADQSFLTAASVLYDAVYIPGGDKHLATLAADPDAIHFLNEAYRHCKAIAADETARAVFESTYFAAIVKEKKKDEGLLFGGAIEPLAKSFSKAIANHRVWSRETARKVPA
jgi:catalase